MTPAEAQGVMPYLAGPGAAVIVLVLVLYGLYVLVVRHGMPLVAALGRRHLDQIDAMISAQREEGRIIARALQTIDRRLARMEGQEVITPNPGALSPDRGA